VEEEVSLLGRKGDKAGGKEGCFYISRSQLLSTGFRFSADELCRFFFVLRHEAVKAFSCSPTKQVRIDM
jgi:hypothetical protein